jgi:hypothetical protein
MFFFYYYQGGAPDLANFTGNRYTQGFYGCIHVLEPVDGRGQINLGSKTISALNVDTCPE